jgi:hypothetical protein
MTTALAHSEDAMGATRHYTHPGADGWVSLLYDTAEYWWDRQYSLRVCRCGAVAYSPLHSSLAEALSSCRCSVRPRFG